MASLSGDFNIQEFTDDGAPLVSGRLYTYVYGTTTQKTAYTDIAEAVPHTYTSDGAGGQYIGLNARGELPAPLYLKTGAYDIVLKRADGSTVWTRRADGINADLGASTGAGLVGWIRNAVGAVATTLAKWMGWQEPNLFEFMTDAQVTDVQNRALTLDVSAAVAAAVLANPNKIIRAPAGTYKLTSGVALAAAQHIRGDGPTSTIFSCSDAFDAFTLSSSYAGVSDCSFTSASSRTANAYVKLSAATRGNFVRRVTMTNAFIGVWIAAEAVINYFEDIELVNTTPATGVGIWINGGNDTFLNRIVMDAPVGSQPLCGIRMQRTQATWTTDCDMIHQGRGIQIDPDAAGLITWCFFTNVACDLGTGDGLYVNPNNATVKGLFFNNCWFSSNLNGTNLTRTGTGAVDGVFFNNCTLFNNNNRGGWTQIASNVEYSNCRISGNSQAASGTYAGIEYANNVTSFSMHGNRSGAIAGFANTQSYGLLIGTGCDQYVMSDNNLIGNVTAGALDNSQTTSGTRAVRDNLGFKTISAGVATLLTGTNQISVTHGLNGTPSVALATPSNVNLAGLSFWTGVFGATTFNINTSANVGSDSPFSWTASLYN